MVNIINIPTSLLFDISIIIIIATILAYFLRMIKQPLIPAYIIAGVILGPIGFNLINDLTLVNSLSEIGIAFLLFIVGLEIDLKKLRSVGTISIFGGIIQVALTALIGFVAAQLFGFSLIPSIYVGFILAFSSTMLVVKILKDKDQVDTLHGKIMIGILLIQDLLVIFILSFLSTISYFNISIILIALLKGAIFILFSLLIGKFVLRKLLEFAAKSEELLFLCSLSICFLFALFAYYIGFSIAIGAFLAGVILASSPYSLEIISTVGNLKNFFVTIFFVSLGMQLVLVPKGMISILFIFLLLTIIIKPLIIMILTSLFGYEKRTSFLTSFGLGQISEFSLIMVSFGFYTLNQLSQNFFSLMIFATIISMIITSYTAKYDARLYMKLSRYLQIFEKLSLTEKKFEFNKKIKPMIVLIGCHRMGSIFLKLLDSYNKDIFVIDHNPEIIKSLMQKNINCIYGDCTNIEILKKINVRTARIVISAIPDLEINRFLLKYIKSLNKNALFIATQNHLHEALKLYELNVDYVIMPHISTSESSISLLKSLLKNKTSIREIRSRHIKHLLDINLHSL